MRISDQSAAIKLAICDDIGERSYDVTNVAAILVQMLSKHPTVGVFPSLFSNCSVFFVKLDIFLCFNAKNFYLFVAGTKAMYNRYKIEMDCQCGKT